MTEKRVIWLEKRNTFGDQQTQNTDNIKKKKKIKLERKIIKILYLGGEGQGRIFTPVYGGGDGEPVPGAGRGVHQGRRQSRDTVSGTRQYRETGTKWHSQFEKGRKQISQVACIKILTKVERHQKKMLKRVAKDLKGEIRKSKQGLKMSKNRYTF